MNPISPIIPTPCKDLPPEKDGWAFELKLDGFRGLADTINGLMLSKNLNPLKRFQHLLDSLPLDCVFDGEICVLDQDGRPDFNALRETALNSRPSNGPDMRVIPSHAAAPLWRAGRITGACA